MPCCRCNGSGSCRGCSCAKNGEICTNCLPLRRGHCRNTGPRDLPIATSPNHAESTAPGNALPQATSLVTSPEQPTQTLIGNTDRAGDPHETSDACAVASTADLLPPYTPLSTVDHAYRWGSADGPAICLKVNSCYEETVHWRRNVFSVPSGKAGKEFVAEMARLYLSYAEESQIESFALTAAMTLPPLILQKPYRGSKARDHVKCVERRMQLWRDGDIDSLLHEGRAIQQRLGPYADNNTHDARTFANHMMNGKVKSAVRLLTSDPKGTPLPLDKVVSSSSGTDTVRNILHKKHPAGRPVTVSTLLPEDGAPQPTHPIVFESLTGHLIRATALRTEGAAGPSGIDALGWRRICTSFHDASRALCDAIAAVSRRLCTTYVDPVGLKALISCRLIALDKQPGVRPIGIGEVSRRIIGKAILSIIKEDILKTAGVKQLCVGQQSGCEAAIHAMTTVFDTPSCQAILQVDATNAFNNLNRRAALINIHRSCPSLATILTNTYRQESSMFIGGEVIPSCEGTTQGDPLAMAMFALAVLPLIDSLNPEVNQCWYADDASAGGELQDLKSWWDRLSQLGPQYGYFPNPGKTWLIVKEQHHVTAQDAFGDTGISITTEGKQYLGAAIGSADFSEEFVKRKVEEWTAEIEKLALIAKTHPHAAYAAYTHGLSHKWKFLLRTIPSLRNLLSPLETAIRTRLIPAFTSKSDLNDHVRGVLALPPRLGGLGVANPQEECEHEYAASRKVSSPLTEQILQQPHPIQSYNVEGQKECRKAISQEKRQRTGDEAERLLQKLPEQMERMVNLAAEKGASSWLAALPIDEHGFHLHKSAFRDAICLRYGWTPEHLPEKCICGSHFSVEHALTCSHGGFRFLRHNEIRDLTAKLLMEVCPNVKTEPELQPLTGENLTYTSANRQDSARLDVRAQGFWGEQRQDAFSDVRVFNPHAPSNRHSSLEACYRKHEKEKRRSYDQRIREIERGSFAPLVFSATGGMGPAAQIVYKRLASMISEKSSQSYSTTMGWIRCRLSFSLLRSAIMCIRGSRSSYHHPIYPSVPIDVIAREGRVTDQQ